MLLRSNSQLTNWSTSFSRTDTGTKVTAGHTRALFIHPMVCHGTMGFLLPKLILYVSSYLVSSSATPRLVTIQLFLCLPSLHLPSDLHSRILRGNLFPGILFIYPNYRNRFSSITANTLFPTFTDAALGVIYKLFFSRLPCPSSPYIHLSCKYFISVLRN